ncbi:uncharacterized protein LOC110247362 isoform X2 [Exaiptasia diaphana]|uniref:Uncharacterized protein n=1 Tax=Exaiptasia diaphana TaxID=2652724 RepID=A0A913XUP2_EXADI|nr:uncharacterized protein LOC110247362 isoform X2 [Exaiptasia diaphana]
MNTNNLTSYVSAEDCKVLQAHKVTDLTTLKTLTRPDLTDIFPGPENFFTRKRLWVVIEDLRNQEKRVINAGMVELKSRPNFIVKREHRKISSRFSSDSDSDEESKLEALSDICQAFETSTVLSEEVSSHYINEIERKTSLVINQTCKKSTELDDEIYSQDGELEEWKKHMQNAYRELLNIVTNDENELDHVPASISPSSTPKTRSVSSSSVYSSPSDIDESQDEVPTLKRSSGVLQEDIDLLENFSFPVSAEMKACCKNSTFPSNSTRTAFLRDCYTCLTAITGPNPGNVQFQMAAKKILDKVPVLKDIKPPAWPKEKPFPYWDSVVRSLKKRQYNRNNTSKKVKLESSDATAMMNEDGDCSKHYKTLQTELKRKNTNVDVVKHLLSITFQKRKDEIQSSEASAKEAVSQLIKDYPFFQNESVLLIELELHLKLKRGEITEECVPELINNFETVQRDMKLNAHSGPTSLHAINELCRHFNCIPIIYSLEGDQPLQDFIAKTVSTTAPALVVLEEDESQEFFIVIDKKEFLELSKDSTPAKALVVLLAVYYALDLQYDPKQALCFKFLEEYVLKVPQAKRSLKYKQPTLPM